MDGLQATVDSLSGVILDLMSAREDLIRRLAGDVLVSLPASSEDVVRAHSRLSEVRNELRAFAADDLLAHIPHQDSPASCGVSAHGPG